MRVCTYLRKSSNGFIHVHRPISCLLHPIALHAIQPPMDCLRAVVQNESLRRRCGDICSVFTAFTIWFTIWFTATVVVRTD